MEDKGVVEQKPWKFKVFIVLLVVILLIFILFLVGRKRQDLSCEEIADELIKRACELCEKSEHPSNCIDELFYSKAREKQDKQLCEKISDKVLQDACILDADAASKGVRRPTGEAVGEPGYKES